MGLDEVEQALLAPEGLRFERHIGDLLLAVMGIAGNARVIAVLCDRMERTTTYKILSAPCSHRCRLPASDVGEALPVIDVNREAV